MNSCINYDMTKQRPEVQSEALQLKLSFTNTSRSYVTWLKMSVHTKLQKTFSHNSWCLSVQAVLVLLVKVIKNLYLRFLHPTKVMEVNENESNETRHFFPGDFG